MKKYYETPEVEKIMFDFKDVILSSPTEQTIPEIIGGDGNETGNPLDDF